MNKDVSDDNFQIIEVYPYVYVYKNIFKNIDEAYSLLKDPNSHNGIFSEWSQWSIFGDYLNPPFSENSDGIKYDNKDKYRNIDKINPKNDLEEKQKQFLMELLDGFYSITKDYANKHNINIDEKTEIFSELEGPSPLWRSTGPTICKYHISDETNKHGMRYHSDYIREQQQRPGYKFAITGLAYFNDDYVGGELDFVIGNKLVKYKPQAGDYIVFPSGHPDFLTEDGQIYLHGVMPAEGTHKYFSRMYWQVYYEGSEQWFENENKFGKDVWLSMQPELEDQFRKEHPQRAHIENGVRLQ